MAEISFPLLLAQNQHTGLPTSTQQQFISAGLAKLRRVFTRGHLRQNAARPRIPSVSSDSTSSTSCASSTTCVESTAYEQPTALSERAIGVWDAGEAIRGFLEERWSSHADYIKVTCDATLAELHALGRLPRVEGSLACQALIRVPMIHEEVASSLWEHLTEEAQNLPTTSTDEGDGRPSAPVRTTMTTTTVHLKTSLKEARRVTREFLRKYRTQQRHEMAEKLATALRCPLCSGHCLADSPRSTPSQDEDGFWHSADPPKPWALSNEDSTAATDAPSYFDMLRAATPENYRWDSRWLGRLGLVSSVSSSPRSSGAPSPSSASSHAIRARSWSWGSIGK